MTSHTKPWKDAQISELTKLFNDYPVVALANIEAFPASLFALVRKKLSGRAVVRVSKKNLVKLAISQSKLKGKGLESHVSRSCAVLFTKENPFEIYSFLKKNKGSVFAKEGMIAPNDILVPAGDTGLPPGPALSDLKQAGLNVRPMGATIHVVDDKVVTKAGQAVTKPVAGTLLKLGIKPIKIGLNIRAAYEKGEIFLPEVLDIDAEKVYADFVAAASDSFRLAIGIAYPTPQTMPLLLRKAALESFTLAVEAGIYAKETIELLGGKANAQASTLKSKVKGAPAEEKPADEKPAEEAKPAEGKDAKPAGKEAKPSKESDAKPEEKSEGEEEKKVKKEKEEK